MVINQVQNRIKLKKERLDEYRKAESKILKSQSYTLGSKTLTRADLKDVQKMIETLENEIAALETHGNKKRRVRRVIPID